MNEEIVELVTGAGISVKGPDGSFQQVPTPEGFTAAGFRNAVAAFDAAYRLQGSLPNVDQVHQFWPKLPKESYATLFLTEEFKDALRYRGVEWDIDSGLSTEQTYVLLALTNWTDRRSTAIKLKELGVPISRHQAWMKQPLYAASYRQRTEDAFADAVPMALQRLMGNAEAGDFQSIKLILEATGRWNPSATAVDDARAVVLAAVEAIVKHVPDPEVRKAILSEISLTAGTLGAVSQRRALEGPQ